MSDDKEPRRRILRRQQLRPNGKPSATDWRPAIEELEELQFHGRGMWRPIGPAPLDVHRDQLVNGIGAAAGEVLDLAFDPGGDGGLTTYIATNGGVWRSDDGGTSWRPLTDMLPTLSMSAVAVDPSDTTIVYAGTRNLASGADVIPRALGLWKSDDRGETWAPLDGGPDATVMNQGINHIICPAPNVVMVGCPNGLFLSVDAGSNFGKNAPAFDDLQPLRSGNITALEIDSSSQLRRPVEGTVAGNPLVVKSKSHGFLNGQTVSIGGAIDSKANGTFTIEVTQNDLDSFKLVGVSSTATNGAGGIIVGPDHPNVLSVIGVAQNSPKATIVVTTTAHELVTGDIVAVAGVGGVTGANGSWSVRVLSDTTFELVGSTFAGSFTSGGHVEAPRHAKPLNISSVANATDGVDLEVPGHTFLDGDRVMVTGVSGINDGANSGIVRVSTTDPKHIVVVGLKMSGTFTSGTVRGPAASWNTAYFAIGGRTSDGTKEQKDSGVFRITLTGDAQRDVAISSDIIANVRPLKGKYDRLRIAQSTEPRSRILYLAAQTTHPTTRFLDILRSDDMGASWRSVLSKSLLANLAKDGTSNSDEALTLGVDPQSPNRVYLGLRQLWRSEDGGVSWPEGEIGTEGGDLPQLVSQVAHAPSTGRLHVGHRAMAFVPPTRWVPSTQQSTPPTSVYFATAGGVASSDDAAVSYKHLNQGLSIALVTSLAMGRGTGSDASAAGIDDGGIGTAPQDLPFPWVQGISGSGGRVVVHPEHPERVFGFVDGAFVRSQNGGVEWMRKTTKRAIVTGIRNFNQLQIDTLGHPFKPQEVVTIGNVQKGLHDVAAVNGSQTQNNEGDTILRFRKLDGAALGPFDRPPTVFGNRFLRELPITSIKSDAPIQVTTARPHGITSPNTIVRVEDVVAVPGANNDVTRPFWKANRVSDTVIELATSVAPSSTPVVETNGRLRIADGLGEASIQNATFADPIVVTSIDHGLVSGDSVSISFVRGNTNANVNGARITVIDRNSFVLDGVAGNAVFGPAPYVEGNAVGYGLPASNGSEQQRIAIAPGILPDSFVLFASVGRSVFRSDDLGTTFQHIGDFTSEVTALAATRSGNVWVGLAGGAGKLPSVHRGGGKAKEWDIDGFFGPDFISEPGCRGPISAIVIDTDPTHVLVTASGYSEVDSPRGTHHVFDTSTGGMDPKTPLFKAWRELRNPIPPSPNFTPIPGLPDIPVHDAVFAIGDSAQDVLIASDGGVARFNLEAKFERVGANLPTISCQALAIDTSVSENRSRVRVGTYGRGVWELDRDTVGVLVVRASLGFGERPQNLPARLPLLVHNPGKDSIVIKSIGAASIDGAGNFDVVRQPSPVTFPFTLSAGENLRFDVIFTPAGTGFQRAEVRIETVSPIAQIVRVPITGTGVFAGKPRVSFRSTRIRFGRESTTFGTGPSLPLTIRNTGTGAAAITKVELTPSTGTPFSIVAPTTPFTLDAGDKKTVDVTFFPAKTGSFSATVRIESVPVGQTVPVSTLTVTLTGEGVSGGSDVLASTMRSLGLAPESETAIA